MRSKKYQRMVFILGLLLGFSYLSAFGQAPTSTPNYQKLVDGLIIQDFSLGNETADLDAFGESPSLDIYVAFLNLTHSQEQEIIPYMRKVAKLKFDLRMTDYEYQEIKSPQEVKKIDEKAAARSDELKMVPSKLKNIFGDKVYKRYRNFLLWAYFNLPDWGSETGIKMHEWQFIDTGNDRDLKSAGVLDPNNRRKVLNIMYEDYKDFIDQRGSMSRENRPSRRPNVPFVDARIKYLQQFLKNRAKRKESVSDVLKNEKINADGKENLVFILNEP